MCVLVDLTVKIGAIAVRFLGKGNMNKIQSQATSTRPPLLFSFVPAGARTQCLYRFSAGIGLPSLPRRATTPASTRCEDDARPRLFRLAATSAGRLVRQRFQTGGLQSAGDWVRDDLYMRYGAGAKGGRKSRTSRDESAFFGRHRITPRQRWRVEQLACSGSTCF